jgi:Family of unknown function (DUF6194)
MDEDAVASWIDGAFERTDHVVTDGSWFFFYDPDHLFPFATLVTTNLYDQASDLDRPGVYRLNVGVSKETWMSLFGEPTAREQGEYGVGSGTDVEHDFTALDTLLPHPVYGRMFWVSVLNPSESTFETVKPLLAEAYQREKMRVDRKTAHRMGDDPAG